MDRTRWRFRILALVVLLATGGLIGAFVAHAIGPRSSPSRAEIAAIKEERALAKLRGEEVANVAASSALVDVPSGSNVASSDPLIVYRKPMRSAEVLGFIPYWTASSITPVELDHVSEIALFGVEVGPHGNFVETGPGWSDYASSGYRSLVAAAHLAGDRVLFTISTTRTSIIRRLVSQPAATSANLAHALAGAVQSGGIDGVDIDIEGSGPSDRASFVVFMRDLVRALRVDKMDGEIVLDTYPQSAGDSTNFFDVAKLAPYVDRVFIMGYDMEQFANATPTAPLYASDLGLSDVLSLIQYLKVVPAQKLLLGIPFYGVDFTTAGKAKGAQALKPYPTEVTYEAILAAGHPPMWDRTTRTAWTHFKIGKTWHETWYDNPVSVALKRALAAHFRIAGVGVWALGFEGGATYMLDALDGSVPPKHLALGPGAPA
ncbi:MAG: glycosyl hydrolase family 18 protein [Acidimicrobiales bacterium]